MKKLVFLFFVITIFLFCFPKSDRVEKVMEDGIEVIINHLEPYKIKGEPANLTLEKEFSIDFARDDIGELGIANATDFEVDSLGNIYFFYGDREGDLIFKFDPQGDYLTSFGTKGQGPEEIQYIVWIGVNSRDNIIISDNGNRKILFFFDDGSFNKEIRYPSKVGMLLPLENGNFFGLWQKLAEDSEKYNYMWAFSLYDPEFEEIRLLDTQNVYDPDIQGFRGIISRPFNARQMTEENIYVACEDRGYEILKYDLKGNLIQKIRKEYRKVAISEELMKERKSRYEP